MVFPATMIKRLKSKFKLNKTGKQITGYWVEADNVFLYIIFGNEQ